MTLLSPSPWLEAVIANRAPLSRVPTEVSPRLRELSSIRGVVFDVYGTLLISGSGDVGTRASAAPASSSALASSASMGAMAAPDNLVAAAMAAAGFPMSELTTIPTAEDLRQQIRDQNDRRRGPACPVPEVDILQAWRATLRRAGIDAAASEGVVRLASEYESRVNPTWPMPGAAALLAAISAAGLPLGIVSNAQVFTVPLVRQLAEATQLTGRGFDLDLCLFSHRFRHAKPGLRLFEILVQGLQRRGLTPQQVIYVGNDMLNDVWAASQVGLRTAWFAGDARSCRARREDSRCRGLEPDLVLTELSQLPACLRLG